MQFGWAVLMLCGFLFWEAWPLRPGPQFKARWAPVLMGVAGLMALFVVQLYNSAMGMNPAALSGMALGIYLIIFGNFLWVFGWAGVRHFSFPALFFVLALPMPGFIYGPVVSSLQSLVVSIDATLLSLMGIPAQRTGNLIQLPTGIVGVNEACSGVRSAQSTVMATLFIGSLVLKNRSLKVTLLVVGVGLAVVGNVVRSLYLCLRANAEGIQAVDEAHDTAGWSILLFTTVGVALTAWWFAKLDRRIGEARERAAARAAGAANRQAVDSPRPLLE